MYSIEKCYICYGDCVPIKHGGGGSLEPYLFIPTCGSIDIVGCINCGTIRFSQKAMDYIKIRNKDNKLIDTIKQLP